MANAVPRVALLARAGVARDQLRRVLAEAGATLVAEGDPADLDPDSLLALSPTLVVVGIEPAVETALERFDSLFDAPGVEVMFDDAEVTNGLNGWDLNRWARHLVGKLVGTDLLSPSPEERPLAADMDLTPEPGVLQSPAELMADARLEDYTLDTLELADTVPTDTAFAVGTMDFNDMEAVAIEGSPDEDVARMAADLEAFEGFEAGPETDGLEALFGHAPDAGMIRESHSENLALPPAADEAPAPAMDFGSLSLLDVDAPLQAVAPAPAAATPTFADSGLSLTPMEGEAVAGLAESGGAVVILAGLGGPDAVRQVLSSLPNRFPAPVLLHQHLEVGKYDRLVEQLAKVSRLPVALAREGDIARAGCVTVLPAGMTVNSEGAALRFAGGTLDHLIAALAPRGSVVVFLSGADASLASAAATLQDAGGLALAQDPEVCFDPSASLAAQEKGASVYPALGLARQISMRWSL